MQAASLALLLPLTGCDGWEFLQSEEAASSAEPFRLSILSAETCPLPPELDPKEVTIVSYRVRLRGQHPQGVPANYFYASLLATDGSRYLADFPGCSPVLSGPPLLPGEVAEGFLNFPIPPSSSPETLVFSPELTGRSAERPHVELSLQGADASSGDEHRGEVE